ncbi:MAG: hypothetical protein JO051_11535 [Acidobacteriaceae bacterium]|nr:hypothetical protein [Acidobacteriaceae bacterium]
MSRFLSGMLAVLCLTACGPGIRTREKVQEAIINRLQSKSGLDVNALDVTTTAVDFRKNMAYATVSIHPKSDPSIQSMVMKYTLESREGKWVVTNVADSQGHGMVGQPAANTEQGLPPGHPAVPTGGSGLTQ